MPTLFDLSPPNTGTPTRAPSPDPVAPGLAFEVYGIARPKGSTRAFMPKGARFPIITSANTGVKGWEDAIRARLQEVAGGVFFDGPVSVAIVFRLPRPKSRKRDRYHGTKPDLDKLVRGSLDALKGVIWKDDSQVVDLRAYKRYADGQPSAEFIIERME
jgi:Holliday junction resolvase RusA-like endonuclease